MVWIPRQTGGEMNEVEMQELQNRVVESIQDYFDAYDWDGKFIQHFGESGWWSSAEGYLSLTFAMIVIG